MLGLIRFSHTIFALPFAVLAAVLALHVPLPSGEMPTLRLRDAAGILLCMVFARSASMAFNRLVDHDIDADNPRTAGRHLPAGLLKRGEVWGFTIFCCIGFVASTLAFWPNWIPLAASTPVLAFLLGYSLAKRFTWAVHFWLGTALSLAPVCVWVALRGQAILASPGDLLPSLVLAAAVATWVAGFDMIYACQDEQFDRQQGLKSVPAWLGTRGALRLAAACHGMMVGCLALLPLSSAALGLGIVYYGAIGLIALLLIYEHWLVRPDDLQRVNVAFFHINAAISIWLLLAAWLDTWYIGAG
ncbi:MAG: UbiA-like polyprenyltransferase [Pirellulaceae bacterium]